MQAQVNCWYCKKAIDEQDGHCRWCGHGQGANIPWYYSPISIALLTIFALGPFSLPLIWRSPKLTDQGRWIGSILVTVYTIYLVYSTFQAIRMVSNLKGMLP